MAVNPITEVYREMVKIGYKLDDFNEWEKRIQLFHVTETGGVAFVSDSDDPSIWWFFVYAPKEKPTDNTVRFLMKLAAAAGCKTIASEIKRGGVGRMLRRVGFTDIGQNIFTIRAS